MTKIDELLARVAEITHRAEKATPGEWVWVEKDSIGRSGVWSNKRPNGDSDAVPSSTEWLICETRHRSSNDPSVLWPFKFGENGECDGEFLAAARSDIPALCDAVRELANPWASVKERLPEYAVRVLILHEDLGEWIGWLCYNNEWADCNGDFVKAPTHWAALPSPPQEAQDGAK